MSTNVHLINLQIMIEVLVATHMIAWFLEHREYYWLRLMMSSGACMLLAWLFPVSNAMPVIGWGLLMYASLFTLSVLGAAVCYRESFVGMLCCTIIGYTIHQASSAANDILFNVTGLLGINLPSQLCWLITIIPVYMLGFRIMSAGIRRHGQIRIDNRMLPLLSIAVLLVDILIGLVVMNLSMVHKVPEYMVLIQFMDFLACCFILMLQRELLSSRSLELQLQIVSQMLQEEKRQYEQSRSNIDLINQKCHDLRHQIRAIRKSDNLIDPSVLKEIEHAVDIYDTSVQTGCTALDVILSEKKLSCESHGILITCMADGSGLNSIPAPDIYALFGNILDNAIEAVANLPEDEARSISLSVRTSGAITIIHEENCYAGRISFRDGLPETVKDDKSYHGFGVRSIQTIAEAYNGSLSINADDGVFSLTVMLSA